MRIASVALVLAVALLATWPGSPAKGRETMAQVAVAIGVDADPTGNVATSLGPIDSCLSVSTGETFQVDIVVTDIVDLLAWEAYLVYDMTVVNIAEPPAIMFQGENQGSKVFDLSEALPDIDGLYGVAAADLAEPPAPDSGWGVLARLTLVAVGPGVSQMSLPLLDLNDDGTTDFGPILRDEEGTVIEDADGDGFFDGPIYDAQIVVDGDCPAEATVRTVAPPPSPTREPVPTSPAPQTSPAVTQTQTPTAPEATPTPGSTEDEGSAWTGSPAIIAYVVGGLAGLLLAGIGFLAIGRRRGQ